MISEYNPESDLRIRIRDLASRSLVSVKLTAERSVDDLVECRVDVNRVSDVPDGTGSGFHRYDDFVDQHGCMRTDDVTAENVPGLRIGEHLHEPVGLVHR